MKVSSRSRKERIIANALLAFLVAGFVWQSWLVLTSPHGFGTPLHLAFAALNGYLLHRVAGRRIRALVSRALIPLRLRQAGRRNRRSLPR